ncbi:MAG: transcription antitermination factor NusB, partial [Oscillospiraceae bacterium]|nr:transcription antitermination factor NusB [Oscillospiraceae bacterium]
SSDLVPHGWRIEMTRTAARELAVHFSFELGFDQTDAGQLLGTRLTKEAFERLAEEAPLYGEFPSLKQQKYIRTLVSGVWDHGAELDAYIERYAVGRRFARISRVAAAIMRVAMYELLYMPEIPAATAINEAVELSKKYEEPETSAFINGILGSFVREECGFLRPEASGTDRAKKTVCSASKDAVGTGQAEETVFEAVENIDAASPLFASEKEDALEQELDGGGAAGEPRQE